MFICSIDVVLDPHYKKGDDQQMTVSIGNNSFYSGLINVYFNNTAQTR